MQAATFLGLLKLADVSEVQKLTTSTEADSEPSAGAIPKIEVQTEVPAQSRALDLRYTIEVHLPPTKDIEVFNAIFKSLKQNLMD